MNKVTTQYTTTNNSKKYVVLADYHIILSSHDTADDACDAADKIAPANECDPLANTPYAVIEIVFPGETTTGTMEQTIVKPDQVATAEEIAATLDLFGL
jgi:hypothetical protein